MPLSIVARIGFAGNAAHSSGEPRRPSANSRQRNRAGESRVASQVPDAAAIGDEDADAGPVSTAGLSILAQALAAYSQN